MKPVTEVRCCIQRTSTQFALSRAKAAYRALIVVGLLVLLDIGPECILRMILCGFLQWCLTNKLHRPFRALSNGRPCKHSLYTPGWVAQRCGCYLVTIATGVLLPFGLILSGK